MKQSDATLLGNLRPFSGWQVEPSSRKAGGPGLPRVGGWPRSPHRVPHLRHSLTVAKVGYFRGSENPGHSKHATRSQALPERRPSPLPHLQHPPPRPHPPKPLPHLRARPRTNPQALPPRRPRLRPHARARHLLPSEPATDPLSKAIQALKLSISKQADTHPFWQTRYYDFNVFTRGSDSRSSTTCIATRSRAASSSSPNTGHTPAAATTSPDIPTQPSASRLPTPGPPSPPHPVTSSAARPCPSPSCAPPSPPAPEQPWRTHPRACRTLKLAPQAPRKPKRRVPAPDVPAFGPNPSPDSSLVPCGTGEGTPGRIAHGNPPLPHRPHTTWVEVRGSLTR